MAEIDNRNYISKEACPLVWSNQDIILQRSLAWDDGVILMLYNKYYKIDNLLAAGITEAWLSRFFINSFDNSLDIFDSS